MSATLRNRERRTLEGYGFRTDSFARKVRRERNLSAKRSKREALESSKRGNGS